MAFNSLMHERNIYKERPNFAEIALNYPEFRKYSLSDAKGKVRVDFSDPDALRTLTKILLKKDFNLTVEIPKGFLIPTVPQRLNYILWIEDLLSILPKKNKILRGIDIGCGPCAIFSILGAKKNDWMFTATETSEEALHWALDNIKTNNLSSLIKAVKVESNSTLSEVVSENETYDFCLCNPPFFENMDDIRKKSPKVKETITAVVKEEEIFSDGGEVAFVKKIIEESLIFKERVQLYTSMFGKKKSFVEIFKILQNMNDISVTKSLFCQGNTVRWGVAWTFEKSVNFGAIEKPKPKKKKAKPPLVHHIPKQVQCSEYNVQDLSKFIWNSLKSLEILIKVLRVHEHYTESQITTDKNTWSHQRRKRREMKRNVENTDDNYLLLKSNNPECELIATNDNSKLFKATDFNTSISITNDLCQQGCSAGSKRKFSLDEDKNENLKMTESGKSFEGAYKKRKLDEDDPVSCNTEMDSLKMVVSRKCPTNLNDTSKKRKLEEEDSKSCKRKKEIIDLKMATSDECPGSVDYPIKILKSEKSDNYCDFFQSSVPSLIRPKDDVIVEDFESPKPVDNLQKSETIKNKSKNLIKAEEVSDVSFEPKSLLFCTLKIRRAKDFVLIEMSCPEEANRDSMYQILQYLKNKLH